MKKIKLSKEEIQQLVDKEISRREHESPPPTVLGFIRRKTKLSKEEIQRLVAEEIARREEIERRNAELQRHYHKGGRKSLVALVAVVMIVAGLLYNNRSRQIDVEDTQSQILDNDQSEIIIPEPTSTPINIVHPTPTITPKITPTPEPTLELLPLYTPKPTPTPTPTSAPLPRFDENGYTRLQNFFIDYDTNASMSEVKAAAERKGLKVYSYSTPSEETGKYLDGYLFISASEYTYKSNYSPTCEFDDDYLKIYFWKGDGTKYSFNQAWYYFADGYRIITRNTVDTSPSPSGLRIVEFVVQPNNSGHHFMTAKEALDGAIAEG